MDEPPLEPSAAERVRTILARATSAAVHWLAGSPPDGAGWPDLAPRPLRLDERGPQRSATGAEAARVLVEVADVAPLPVPHRVRGRVRLSGTASVDPGPSGALRVVPQAVLLEREGACRPVDVAEVRTARPDPLATTEGGLLCHLDGAHPEFVAGVSALVEPDLLQGCTRVWPLELDRFGLILRVQHLRSHHDVRLRFPTPAATAAEARLGIHALLARAEAVRRRRCRARAPERRP